MARRTLLAHEEALAERIAARVLELVEARGLLPVTDVSSRRRKEEAEWRDNEVSSSASSDPTGTDDSFGSSSDREARRLLGSLRRKQKQGR